DAKPAAAGLPQLAEGNFRTTSVNSYPLPPQPNLMHPGATTTAPTNTVTSGLLTNNRIVSTPVYRPVAVAPAVRPVSVSTFTSPGTAPGNYPRPLRKGEETTSLWIAPYVDSDDVYHQPATVLFVVTPSAWGQPRLN
ncbi:TPA: type IV conjugative transfer system lipoprotein TraV, partial [Klebsiella pneumoniae]|nr:type IV conjugative transfer system lipoprotein TraV [Klebsiella pneumoniae]